MELEQIIWMILAGIALASIIVLYNKQVLGKFVRKLISIDATSPESAVSAEEMNVRINGFIRLAMRNNGTLHGVVGETGSDTKAYFIFPEQLDRAKSKYRKENLSWILIIAGILLLLAAGFGISLGWPKLTEFWQQLIS